MTQSAASRFPALAPQTAPSPRREALRLSYDSIPLPLGELAILLLAWAMILPG